MSEHEGPFDVQLFARLAELREVNESLVAKLQFNEARIKQLESYLEKTADGKLVRECENLYCLYCSGSVNPGLGNLFYKCDDCDRIVSHKTMCYSTPEASRKSRGGV